MAYTPSTTLTFNKTAYTPSTTLEFDAGNTLSATIEQRIFEVGSISATIEQRIVEGGTLSAVIEQNIFEVATISAAIQQDIFEIGGISATIEQRIVLGVGVLSAPIQQNIFEVGTISTTIEQRIVETGDILSVIIQQEIVAVTGTLSAIIQQDIFESGTISAVIEQNITATTGILSAVIQNDIYEVGSISKQITQVIYGLVNGLPKKPVVWQAFVLLGSLDVSANLTGSIIIDAEEGTAKVASFTLKPSLGVVDLTQWVNQPVTISFGYKDSPEIFTLYKGRVDVPSYDPNDRLTSFVCTDLLQRAFEDTAQEDIKSKIQGLWSKFIFEETNDNWKYAKDVISTVPKSMDYSVDLVLEVTDWAAKPTADFVYNTDCILDESLEVELASIRDITNIINLTFNYQYSGYREAVVTYTWYDSPAIGSLEWLQNAATAVENAQVIDAIEDAGWFAKETPIFTGLPRTQVFHPGGSPVIWLNAFPNGVTFARINAAKRFIQNVTDQVNFVIKSPSSITALGEVPDEVSYGLSAEYEENSESNFTETEEGDYSYLNEKTAGALDVFGTGTYNKYPEFQGQTSAQGYTTYDSEALIVDGTRGEMNDALAVARDVHVAQILSKHRQNKISFTCLLNPLLSRTQTVEVNSLPVKSRGKISHYRQEMNIEEGYAISNVTMSVSKSFALGIADIPAPDEDPVAQPDLPEDPLASGTSIQLGNCVANIPGNFSLTCEIGVDKFGKGTNSLGETEFVVQTPEVVDNNTQDTVNTIDKEYTVSVPQELLTLEA